MITKLKSTIKQHPVLYKAALAIYGKYHAALLAFRVKKLKLRANHIFVGNPATNLIVSLTSFPARIDNVYITIESIFQQSYKPWKIVLVLAEEEFPGKIIPESLTAQVKRGLEIIWVKHNTRSYKKLIPTLVKYPLSHIITVDDDIIYEPWRLAGLVEAAKTHPLTIIGYRGWKVSLDNDTFNPYATWLKADRYTPHGFALLTGVGGIYYPANSLDRSMLFDTDSSQNLAPTADDIWFWAVALKSDTKVLCLGVNKHFPIKFNDVENSLYHVNYGQGKNDEQLEAVASAYNLKNILNSD